MITPPVTLITHGIVAVAAAAGALAWQAHSYEDKLADMRSSIAESGRLRARVCQHDALLAHGWHTRAWTARKGYALTDEATQNTQDETLWCSPHCVPQVGAMADLFAEHA